MSTPVPGKYPLALTAASLQASFNPTRPSWAASGSADRTAGPIRNRSSS